MDDVAIAIIHPNIVRVVNAQESVISCILSALKRLTPIKEHGYSQESVVVHSENEQDGSTVVDVYEIYFKYAYFSNEHVVQGERRKRWVYDSEELTLNHGSAARWVNLKKDEMNITDGSMLNDGLKPTKTSRNIAGQNVQQISFSPIEHLTHIHVGICRILSSMIVSNFDLITSSYFSRDLRCHTTLFYRKHGGALDMKSENERLDNHRDVSSFHLNNATPKTSPSEGGRSGLHMSNTQCKFRCCDADRNTDRMGLTRCEQGHKFFAIAPYDSNSLLLLNVPKVALDDVIKTIHLTWSPGIKSRRTMADDNRSVSVVICLKLAGRPWYNGNREKIYKRKMKDKKKSDNISHLSGDDVELSQAWGHISIDSDDSGTSSNQCRGNGPSSLCKNSSYGGINLTKGTSPIIINAASAALYRTKRRKCELQTRLLILKIAETIMKYDWRHFTTINMNGSADSFFFQWCPGSSKILENTKLSLLIPCDENKLRMLELNALNTNLVKKCIEKHYAIKKNKGATTKSNNTSNQTIKLRSDFCNSIKVTLPDKLFWTETDCGDSDLSSESYETKMLLTNILLNILSHGTKICGSFELSKRGPCSKTTVILCESNSSQSKKKSIPSSHEHSEKHNVNHPHGKKQDINPKSSVVANISLTRSNSLTIMMISSREVQNNQYVVSLKRHMINNIDNLICKRLKWSSFGPRIFKTSHNDLLGNATILEWQLDGQPWLYSAKSNCEDSDYFRDHSFTNGTEYWSGEEQHKNKMSCSFHTKGIVLQSCLLDLFHDVGWQFLLSANVTSKSAIPIDTYYSYMSAPEWLSYPDSQFSSLMECASDCDFHSWYMIINKENFMKYHDRLLNLKYDEKDVSPNQIDSLPEQRENEGLPQRDIFADQDGKVEACDVVNHSHQSSTGDYLSAMELEKGTSDVTTRHRLTTTRKHNKSRRKRSCECSRSSGRSKSRNQSSSKVISSRCKRYTKSGRSSDKKKMRHTSLPHLTDVPPEVDCMTENLEKNVKHNKYNRPSSATSFFPSAEHESVSANLKQYPSSALSSESMGYSKDDGPTKSLPQAEDICCCHQCIGNNSSNIANCSTRITDYNKMLHSSDEMNSPKCKMFGHVSGSCVNSMSHNQQRFPRPLLLKGVSGDDLRRVLTRDHETKVFHCSSCTCAARHWDADVRTRSSSPCQKQMSRSASSLASSSKRSWCARDLRMSSLNDAMGSTNDSSRTDRSSCFKDSDITIPPAYDQVISHYDLRCGDRSQQDHVSSCVDRESCQCHLSHVMSRFNRSRPSSVTRLHCMPCGQDMTTDKFDIFDENEHFRQCRYKAVHSKDLLNEGDCSMRCHTIPTDTDKKSTSITTTTSRINVCQCQSLRKHDSCFHVTSSTTKPSKCAKHQELMKMHYFNSDEYSDDQTAMMNNFERSQNMSSNDLLYIGEFYG